MKNRKDTMSTPMARGKHRSGKGLFHFLPLIAFCASIAIGRSLFEAQSSSASSAPVIFFTDLDSGPNTGGKNNNGTILTIYGKNFGSPQGSSYITIGGQPVASYLQWAAQVGDERMGLQKIAVAIGSQDFGSNQPIVVALPVSSGPR